MLTEICKLTSSSQPTIKKVLSHFGITWCRTLIFNFKTYKMSKQAVKGRALIKRAKQYADSAFDATLARFGEIKKEIETLNLSGEISFEDITYFELYNKVINSELTPLQWYRLTDYKSVNFLNGWEIANNNPTPTDPNFNPREVYEGDTEVLLLQAITESQLSPTGYSENHQQDIIQYNPLVNKIGVNIDFNNGITLPDSSTVSGFDIQWDGEHAYFEMPQNYPVLFGHYLVIYFSLYEGDNYIESFFEPIAPGVTSTPFNFSDDSLKIKIEGNRTKIILLNLTQEDVLNYDIDTLYVSTVVALSDSYGWIERRKDKIKNIDVPFDFRGRKYRRFEVDLSAINPSLGLGFWGQGDDYLGQSTTGNFNDFSPFIYEKTFNIIWEDTGGPNMYGARGFNDNFVALGGFSNNKISYSCFNNTLSGFRNNIIGEYFSNNTIGEDFLYNILHARFMYNTIGGEAYDNIIDNWFMFNNVGKIFRTNKIGVYFIGNTVGEHFDNNTIGTNFLYSSVGDNFYNNAVGNNFFGNTIGFDAISNTIGANFTHNTIGANFTYNTVGDNFYNNDVGNNFQFNIAKVAIESVDFKDEPATHVYNEYTCEIFKRSNGTLQLSYIDATNTVQYSSIVF
jgi:hypothetical protein